MTTEEKDKVIRHAHDCVGYDHYPMLPVRHDRREWTKEEKELFLKEYISYLALIKNRYWDGRGHPYNV